MRTDTRGFHRTDNAGRLVIILLAFVVSACITGCSVSYVEQETVLTGEQSKDMADDAYGNTVISSEKKEPDVDLPGEKEEGELSLGALSEEEQDIPTYTLNIASETLPVNWNPHVFHKGEDGKLADLLTAGLYRYEYQNGAVKEIVPFAAAAYPSDVTEGYVGSFGIKAGERGRVYVIPLRDDIRWEDGTSVTAKDYVNSALRLLDPDASYSGNGLFFAENLVVCGAEGYSRQGRHAYPTLLIPGNTLEPEYIQPEDFIRANGVLTLDGGSSDVAVNIYDGAGFGERGLDYYYRKGVFKGRIRERYNSVIAAKADANGFVSVTEDVYMLISDLIAVLHGYTDAKEYSEVVGDQAYLEWEQMAYVGTTYPAVSVNELGIFTAGEYELVLVLEHQLSGFCLLDALTTNWLVNCWLYDSCINRDGVRYSNNYCTSLETTMSFGPYRLSSFGNGCYTLERNRYFFGYRDSDAADHYMADAVELVTADPKTQMEMFDQGRIDLVYPSGAEAYDKADGENVFRNTGSAVYFMVFNPDYDNLEIAQEKAGEGINKTILSIPEFRQAMSLALDREGFCNAAKPEYIPATGLFASKTIGILDELMTYTRDKEMVVYKPSLAKMYFNTAYEQAIVNGYIHKDDIVEICVGIPYPGEEYYELGYQFLTDSYTQAVKGTLLEGRLCFTRDDTVGSSYAAALRSGQVDMLIGVGWNGSLYDPYGLMEAFTSHTYRYDRSWQAEGTLLTLDIGEKTYTASVCDWTSAINGIQVQLTDSDGNVVNYSCGRTYGDQNDRLMILRSLEGAVIAQYDMIPLAESAEMCIAGERIEVLGECETATYFGNIRDLRFVRADAK